MTPGVSKSKCGQSDEYRSWLSALIMSKVHCSALRLLVSSGWLVYQQDDRMYSLGSFLSNGASDWRIMNWSSSRCIRNGTQASPLSTHRLFSPGNLSGIPDSIQFVICTMLHQTKPSACMPRNVSIVASDGSC